MKFHCMLAALSINFMYVIIGKQNYFAVICVDVVPDDWHLYKEPLGSTFSQKIYGLSLRNR